MHLEDLRPFPVRSAGWQAISYKGLALGLYACRMVRELSANGCNDPGLLLCVRNEMREIVLSLPFLAACA